MKKSYKSLTPECFLIRVDRPLKQYLYNGTLKMMILILTNCSNWHHAFVYKNWPKCLIIISSGFFFTWWVLWEWYNIIFNIWQRAYIGPFYQSNPALYSHWAVESLSNWGKIVPPVLSKWYTTCLTKYCWNFPVLLFLCFFKDSNPPKEGKLSNHSLNNHHTLCLPC